jgi:Ankyrin repeats (3 copies)/MYND finger
VQLLLRKGAAVDARSHTGVTPLMQAQRLRTVTALVNAHADVNAVDTDGFKILHHCAKQGTAESVYQLLLRHGAVLTAFDKNGSTPAHIAGMSGHFADEALLSKAADVYSKTHAAVSNVAQESALSSSKQQQGNAVATDSSGISGSSSSTTSSSGDAAASAAACSEAVESDGKQKKQKVKQPCANCKKLTTKLCRRCAAVYYCSTECQKVCFKDAKHNAECSKVASTIV